jgi:hypothetical protein
LFLEQTEEYVKALEKLDHSTYAAPFWAKRSAVASPMPLLAPVMAMTFPLISDI